MILIDTSVIIDFWRKPTEALKKIFQNHDVFVSGVTKAELLYGARDSNDFYKIINALSAFQEVSISEDIWNKLGENLFVLKKRGVTVPFQDALIATIAINEKLDLWAYDKHYPMIKNVLLDLKLFNNQ